MNSDAKGKEKPAGRSNLQLRVMSAVVLIIVVLALTWWGGLAFRLFAALLGAAVFYEWSFLAKGNFSQSHRVLSAVLLLALLVLLVAGFAAPMFLAATAATFGLAMILAVILQQGFGLAMGLAYAAIPAAILAFLRGDESTGLWAILFLFACVWATDIAAYFTGRFFGGPKLAPAISPSKTWSGAVGGTIAGAAAGVGVVLAGPSVIGIGGVFLIAVAISVVSQFGDLFESAYKRRHGAKDSGNIIPGHGGVMDRVDGLVAGAVALFIIAALLGGVDTPARGLFGL